MWRPSIALNRLIVETAGLHAEVDRALFAPVTPPTLAGYRRFLAQLYGFHAPLEAALAVTAGVDPAFLQSRAKAPLLAADLLALGLARGDHALLARRHVIPPFRATAEAFGWLYVTERITLQHPQLCEQVAEVMPMALALGGTYVTCYDGETAARWRELGAVLDVVAWSPANADRMVAGARAGFRSLRAYLAPRAPGHVAPAPQQVAP